MLDYNAGTVRCRDSSLPGQFVAGTVRCRDSSLPGQFVAGTVRCRDSSLPGQFVAAHRYYSMTGSVRQCVDLSPRAVARVAGILTTIPATDPNHQGGENHVQVPCLRR